MLDPDISTADAARHLHTPEPLDRLTLDRRRFLQLVGMGMGAGLAAGPAGTLLDQLLPGHDPSAWAAGPVTADEGILVVFCMFGGNDGLNTVVPINDGHYYTQHGGLALGPGQVLQLNGTTGLHPELRTLKSLWDLGEVAIVEGIGYPNPNLSHFTSMAYWMGAQPFGAPETGWIGRWLDGLLGSSKNIYAAAEIGQSLPLHLRGAAQRGTVVPTERPEFGASYEPTDQLLYQSMRNAYTTAYGQWFAAVGEATADFLDLASAVAPAYPATMPTPEIVGKAEAAARLINANLGFRVLTLSWADFDSHALQPNMHPFLMRDFDAALARFFAVLDPAWLSRVTVMTFSEFGRTSWANAGAGTDHGTAAPHFVIGQNVRGGFYGQRPSIANLGRWDRMPHHVDFRSYYASIIDGWMGGGSSSVLGGNYENLGLFARAPGVNGDGSVSPGPAVVSAPSRLVPVVPFRLIDTRDGTGGALNRVLGPGERIRCQVAGVGPIPPSGVTAVIANVTAVDASQVNFFTVYPGSTIRPLTSNLNAGPGRPVPNLVLMGVGDDGCIEVYNSHGYAHCLVDVFGYCTTTAGDRFTALSPARLFDTRDGTGVRAGKVANQSPVEIQVAGLHGVPPSGATAVAINLTVTEPDSAGWMRLTPSGEPAGTTSNVNFWPGNTVPNLVICKLGANGRITLDGVGAGAHVLGDVFGYFGPTGQQIRALPPRRLLDTREGVGAPKAQVGGAAIRVPIGGRGQVPANAAAVILNVTATNTTGPSFVTVWPDGEGQPGTSNLNVSAGQTVANLVICRLGYGGALRLASPAASCDLIADVLGYFVD